MAPAQEYDYTSEDYWNLPDGKRAELIDGRLYDRTPPYRIHQELVHLFDRSIGNYIAEQHGSCKVSPAPFTVNLQKNDRVWVEPDICLIGNHNFP